MDKDKANELVADLRVADRLHNPNAETIIRVSADTIRDVAAKYLMPYATEIIRRTVSDLYSAIGRQLPEYDTADDINRLAEGYPADEQRNAIIRAIIALEHLTELLANKAAKTAELIQASIGLLDRIRLAAQPDPPTG